MRALLLSFLIVVAAPACMTQGVIATPAPRAETTQSLPGVDTPESTAPRSTTTNGTGIKPLGNVTPHVDGAPRTCHADTDCTGTFARCIKDVPTEVGICSKECQGDEECTENASWSCGQGVWDQTSGEERQMCLLTCVLNSECPIGTSCNGGYCGTPCSGSNCTEPVCSSHAGYDCGSDGASYWFDSCGDIEELKEVCAAGSQCLFGECIAGSAVPGGTSGGGSPAVEPDTCGPPNTKRCGSSSSIITMNSCGQVVASESCGGGKECSGAICQCMPSSATRCSGGKLWRVDSCGNLKYIQGSC